MLFNYTDPDGDKLAIHTLTESDVRDPVLPLLVGMYRAVDGEVVSCVLSRDALAELRDALTSYLGE